MWIDFSIVDQDGKVTITPINMDTIVTFARLNDPAYPKANSVLYPCGGHFPSLPVTAIFEIIKEKIHV
jgi:hypothetical protein